MICVVLPWGMNPLLVIIHEPNAMRSRSTVTLHQKRLVLQQRPVRGALAAMSHGLRADPTEVSQA